MSDIFAPLGEPDPVSPLPPEEVRRAGDRRRRRRAGLVVGAAVCATAIVVSGTSLALGNRAGTDAGPGPVDESPSPPGVIPAELDLADGQPRDVWAHGSAAPPLVICGERFSPVARATAGAAVVRESKGDLDARHVRVYPDAGTARSVATDLVATFERCPSFTDARGRVWTTSVRTTSYGDQGWVVARTGGGSGAYPEVVHVVRVGPNLLELRKREIHGVAVEDLTRFAGYEVAWLVRRQMCLLTDEGCPWRTDPDVLRPDGWGPWGLGMSREEVLAAGAEEVGDAGSCATVRLGSVTGWLSDTGELVTLQVPEGVTTPEGIGLGSSRDEVLERYWFAERHGGSMLVRASPSTDYRILLEDGRVVRLELTTLGGACD